MPPPTPADDTGCAPTRVGRRDPQRLVLEWPDGLTAALRTADLRRACPCARCVHELTGAPLLDPNSVPDDLQHTGADLVGRYALTLRFADGHDTGIYTWRLLRRLAESADDAP